MLHGLECIRVNASLFGGWTSENNVQKHILSAHTIRRRLSNFLFHIVLHTHTHMHFPRSVLNKKNPCSLCVQALYEVSLLVILCPIDNLEGLAYYCPNESSERTKSSRLGVSVFAISCGIEFSVGLLCSASAMQKSKHGILNVRPKLQNWVHSTQTIRLPLDKRGTMTEILLA